MAQNGDQIQSFRKWVQDPRRQHATKVRDTVESEIRAHFRALGYREVRTPLLVTSPGMEPHVRPFEARAWGASPSKPVFLPTSPEFAMKKLLVGGLEKIFQICPCFRAEPKSNTHHPEFTMLEFYETGIDHHGLMKRVEDLFEAICLRVHGSKKLNYGGQEISFSKPWPVISIPDFFLEKTGIDLGANDALSQLQKYCALKKYHPTPEDTFDDLYFKIWLNELEGILPKDRPCFVTQYPASQSALAQIERDESGREWAARFEVYCGGLELGNAFFELTNPDALQKKHSQEMLVRKKAYTDFPPHPFDEDLYRAQKEGLPKCSGIALGVDRMILLFADETEIVKTMWLPSA